MLSPFLFVIVMEGLTSEVREGLAWEILNADDLIMVAESMESLKKEVLVLKDQLESKGMRLNVKKTKVILSRKNSGETDKSAKWPRVVCGKGVGSNSNQ